MFNVLRRASFIGKARYYFLDRHYNRVIPIVLVALCIATTLFSTLMWRELTTPSLLVGALPIILIAGFLLVVLIYVYMEWMALAVVMMSTLLSAGIGTGTGTSISFTLILLTLWLGLWLFKMVVVERKISLRPSPANIPVFLFAGMVILSFLWSGFFAEPSAAYLFNDKLAVRLMTGFVIIISMLTFLLYGNNIRSIKPIRYIVWYFIIIGAVFAILRIVSGSSLKPLNWNGQFPTWVAILALGQALFNDRLKRWLRIALFLILGSWIYSTYSLGLTWLSGWVPLAIGCMILVFLYSRPIFFTVLVVGVSALLVSQSFVQNTLQAENTESGETRLDAWQHVFDVVERHPLFGAGPAGYYFYFTVTLEGFFQLSHNNYVDIVGQTGIVGFALWLILWGSIGLMTWRTFRIVPRERGFQHALANTLMASFICTIVTMMFGDWVTPFPYTQTLAGVDYTIWAWILPGITLSLYHINRQKQDIGIHNLDTISAKSPSGHSIPAYAASASESN